MFLLLQDPFVIFGSPYTECRKLLTEFILHKDLNKIPRNRNASV